MIEIGDTVTVEYENGTRQTITIITLEQFVAKKLKKENLTDFATDISGVAKAILGKKAGEQGLVPIGNLGEFVVKVIEIHTK